MADNKHIEEVEITEIPDIPEDVELDTVEGLFGPFATDGGEQSVGADRVNPFVGLELTVEEFRNWFAKQQLGSRPYNAIGWHHTYKPNKNTWSGLPTLRGVFNYYAGTLGWPAGKGPHIFLYDGTGRYKPGQQLVYVATHPAANGIAMSYRNDRWLHVEQIEYFDYHGPTPEMNDLSGEVLDILCDRRGISYERVGPGINSPSSPGGILFHRDAPNAGKTCPGRMYTSLPERGGNKAPITPPAKKRELRRSSYQRITFLAKEGGADEQLARTLRAAFNRVSRQNGFSEPADFLAGLVISPAGIRGSARAAWQNDGDYIQMVVVGGPAFRELNHDVQQVVIDYPDKGNLLEAVGASYKDTVTRVRWRVADICDGLVENSIITQEQKDQIMDDIETGGEGKRADLEKISGKASSPEPAFRWPGYVPWQEPKNSGSYIDMFPTHYDLRADVLEVAREVVEKFNVSVNTYFKHPPNSGRKFEFVSFDVWAPEGRGYSLDPVVGRQVWNYLWNRPGIKWYYGIYLGNRWNRFNGWDSNLNGPPGSDAEHNLHMHLTYLLNQ